MSSRRKLLLWTAALFLLVVLLYIPTLRGGFVYDSTAQVLYSDYLHTPSNWVDVLTLRVVGQDELDRNRPLHLASLMLDAAVWDRNPFGYRLTSVLLHALNAALLFAVIAVFLSRDDPNGRDERPARPATFKRARGPHAPTVVFAAFGALVFALHPLVVEAVAEPSNREDLLVLLPLLVGLLAIVSPVRSRWGVMALLVLAVLIAGVLWLGRTSRVVALGASLYVLAPLPDSNFAAQFHPMADRYLYVPLAGLGLMAAALAHRLGIRFSSRLAGGLLGAVGLGLLFAEYAANLRRKRC